MQVLVYERLKKEHLSVYNKYLLKGKHLQSEESAKAEYQRKRDKFEKKLKKKANLLKRGAWTVAVDLMDRV